MANKERNKRSARKARAQERAEREAQQQVSQATAEPAKSSVISKVKGSDKPESKKDKKPGLFGRLKNYFKEVRVELHRVISPSRKDLTNYSVAALAMLVVFGVVVWLVDTGIVAVLAAFTGLRG